MPIIIPGPDADLAFATAADVATRLGRVLTADEVSQIEGALVDVAGLIRDAARKAPDWMPDPVPPLFKSLSIEKAVGVLVNPFNLASASEQLGAYQHSQTFPRSADVGVFLTDLEARRVRRATYGTLTASVRPSSIIDDIRRRVDDDQVTVVDTAEEEAGL